MKRICILLFITLGFMLFAQAQTTITITGSVVCNGQPVPNATVTIQDSLSGITGTVLTDSVGNYSFSFMSNTTQGMVTASSAGPGGNFTYVYGFYNPGQPVTRLTAIEICGSGGGSNCQASFSRSPSVLNPLMYMFSDNSSGGNPATPVNSWAWDFGDGNTSTAQNPSHTYGSAGTYNVCLIISTGTCSDTSCQVITINTAPACQAAFSFQASPNGQVAFINGSRGGTAPFAYLWTFGDGNTATTSNAFHTYATSGVYVACLVVTDATGCVDSACQTVTITAPPACNASFSFLPNALGVQFSDASTGLSPAAQNSYAWDFGDGNTSTAQNPLHTYATGGTYTACLIFTSAAGGMTCSDTSCTTITLQSNPNRAIISGQVFKNQIGADSVKVWLIAHDSIAGTLTAIDSTITFPTAFGSGFYEFANLPAGNYRSKAALDPTDPDYASYLPTYHDNDLMWNNATVISLTANASANADINMVAGVNPGGPGFIGGLISQGANKRDPGDPLENVHVYLLDNNDDAVAYALTDAQGAYEFSNIAYGTYRVHVEILGKNYTDQYITISAASSAATNVNFAVNSTDIDVTTALEGPQFGKVMRLYPNPTSGEVYIDLSLDKSVELKIQVMDMLGRSHYAQQQQLLAGEQKLQLNLNKLSSGVYFINISADNQIISQKVVVE